MTRTRSRAAVRFRLADPRDRIDLQHRTAPQRGRMHAASQTWTSLLFAHYRADPDALASLLPRSATLDLYDDQAWVTVSPFRIVLRPLPDLLLPTPTLRFLEVNVRTYARVDGHPGILFFSLDATSGTAVRTARRIYRLPYQLATGSLRCDHSQVAFAAKRCDASIRFEASYRPAGIPRQADAGSLEHFLVERYRLYAVAPAGDVISADIHHRPWLLTPAEATVWADDLLRGLPITDRDPLTHYCSRQDVLTWLPRGERA